MKFAEIIREAGIDVKEFPNASNISIILYDRKDRIQKDETIHFVEPLFCHNPVSKKNFYFFLVRLEESDIQSMNVKIDEYAVWAFYKSLNLRFFIRF